MKPISFFCLAAALLPLTGCQTTKVGPSALTNLHQAYSQSLGATLDEQLLINIVRLRYRDNPVFLETNVITQNNKASGSLNFDFTKTFLSAQRYAGSGAVKPGAGCEDSSQLVFRQLTGREFIMKLMTPVQIPVIVAMIQSGWRADRVFDLCVERVNYLYNAPTASGPTPILAPEFEKFYRFTDLLRVLQSANLIDFGEQPSVNFADLVLRVNDHPAWAKEVAEFKRLASLDARSTDFRFKNSFLEMSPTKLTLRPRSLLGMFFFVSQGVEVPAEDEAQGLVTITKNLDGSKFDWAPLASRFLTVRHSLGKLKPSNAFVACHYRNKWFYITDDDLESKTSFMLLSQIFTLQSSKYKSSEPVLVLSGS
jgi:hypothetical protein